MSDIRPPYPVAVHFRVLEISIYMSQCEKLHSVEICASNYMHVFDFDRSPLLDAVVRLYSALVFCWSDVVGSRCTSIEPRIFCTANDNKCDVSIRLRQSSQDSISVILVVVA